MKKSSFWSVDGKSPVKKKRGFPKSGFLLKKAKHIFFLLVQ